MPKLKKFKMINIINKETCMTNVLIGHNGHL